MNKTTQKIYTIGKKLGIDFNKIPLKELIEGVKEEKEHDTGDTKTDIVPGTNNLVYLVKIAYAHLQEDPNYYSKLKKALKGKIKEMNNISLLKNLEEVKNIGKAYVIEHDGKVKLLEPNTGQTLFSNVLKLNPLQWKKIFSEFGIYEVEVKLNGQYRFVKDGTYSVKKFLRIISHLNPAQGKVVPVNEEQKIVYELIESMIKQKLNKFIKNKIKVGKNNDVV